MPRNDPGRVEVLKQRIQEQLREFDGVLDNMATGDVVRRSNANTFLHTLNERDMKNTETILKRQNLPKVERAKMLQKQTGLQSVRSMLGGIRKALAERMGQVTSAYRKIHGGGLDANSIKAIANRRSDLLRRAAVVTGVLPRLLRGAVIPPMSLIGLPSTLEEVAELRKKSEAEFKRRNMT